MMRTKNNTINPVMDTDPVEYFYEEYKEDFNLKQSLPLDTLLDKVDSIEVIPFTRGLYSACDHIVDKSGAKVERFFVGLKNEETVEKIFHDEHVQEDGEVYTAKVLFPKKESEDPYRLFLLNEKELRAECEKEDITLWPTICRDIVIDYIDAAVSIYVYRNYKNVSAARRIFLAEMVSMLVIKSFAGDIDFHYKKVNHHYEKLVENEQTPLDNDFINLVEKCYHQMVH